MAVLFSSGFETGDLTEWSSATTNSGDLSAAAGAALHGSYGLSCLCNDGTAQYVQDDTPSAEKRYRARFYFDPNSFSVGVGHEGILMHAEDTAPAYGAFDVVYKNDGGTLKIYLKSENDSGTTSSSLYAITDAPHYIEIDWQASSGAGANNGRFQLWIDGVSKHELTGLDNDTKQVGFVRFGATYKNAATTGTYYLDSFVSNDDGGEIGPVADAVAPSARTNMTTNSKFLG